MNEKRNEEYWALKERLDKSGAEATVLVPLITLPTLMFGGAIVGQMIFGPNGFLIGGALGGVTAQVVCLTFWKRKLGFIMFSNELCQSCGASVAQWHLRKIQLRPICPNCGNDNRIDLHDT